jgi:hypothetical protein
VRDYERFRAEKSRRKLLLLEQANLRLQKLRYLVRLCKDRRCLSLGQYEFAARAITEIGTDLGGWIASSAAARATCGPCRRIPPDSPRRRAAGGAGVMVMIK